MGGHVNTVEVEIGGIRQPVDTGFIVYNEVNYPNLVRLFAHLGVATEKSDMSFAVSARDDGLEYAGGRGLRGLLAQPSNTLRPAFWGMVADILRFNRRADAAIDLPADLSLGDWLAKQALGDGFRDDHLLPMTAAIWSASTDEMLRFPAAALFRFLRGHGLLKIVGRPQWRTVSGGAKSYVDALIRDFNGNVYMNKPVTRIRRAGNDVRLEIPGMDQQTYDAAVIATHPDQALTLVEDADDEERDVLGAVRYAPNRAVLHRDRGFMPRRRAAWASWNYVTDDAGDQVTYWMNRLQNIRTIDNLFVTLNPPREPADIIASFDYAHPQFDRPAIEAQSRLPAIQGRRNTWYCGAWCGYGFHEDGLASGIRVAEAFDAPPPWVAGKGERG